MPGDEHERRVPHVEVGEVTHVVDEHRAPRASTVGPVLDARLKEGPVHDQLRPAVEQVGQRQFAVGSDEPVVLLDLNPRQPAPLGSKLVAALVAAFSFFSSGSRAACHSSSETTRGVSMPLVSMPVVVITFAPSSSAPSALRASSSPLRRHEVGFPPLEPEVMAPRSSRRRVRRSSPVRVAVRRPAPAYAELNATEGCLVTSSAAWATAPPPASTARHHSGRRRRSWVSSSLATALRNARPAHRTGQWRVGR